MKHFKVLPLAAVILSVTSPTNAAIQTASNTQLVDASGNQHSVQRENSLPIISFIDPPSSASPGETVTLKASIRDYDGEIYFMNWSQVSGPQVQNLSTRYSQATFTIPNIAGQQQITFEFTARDDDGGVSKKRLSITVQGNENNQAPSITVLPFEAVNEGETAQISIQAEDSDGQVSSIQWQQTAGIAAQLTGATTETLSLVAPNVQQQTRLAFQVTVTDNLGLSSTELVSIDINNLANQAPSVSVAPVSVGTGFPVSLSAVASDSDGEVVSYAWRQTSGPAVTLAQTSNATLEFTAPNSEQSLELGFEVVVTDNEGASHSADVTVSVVPRNYEILVQGNVSSNDISGSTLTVRAGDYQSTASVDSNGNYALNLSASAIEPTEMIILEVTKANKDFGLQTAIGTLEELRTKTGDDNILAQSEHPWLHINALNTVYTALAKRNATALNSFADYQQFLRTLPQQDIFPLFDVVFCTNNNGKTVSGGFIINPSIPSEFSSVLELLDDQSALHAYARDSMNNYKSFSLKAFCESDSLTLANPVEADFVGSYFIRPANSSGKHDFTLDNLRENTLDKLSVFSTDQWSTASPIQHYGVWPTRIDLRENGEGSLITNIHNSVDITWTYDSSGIQIAIPAGPEILNQASENREYQLRGLTLKWVNRNDDFENWLVKFDFTYQENGSVGDQALESYAHLTAITSEGLLSPTRLENRELPLHLWQEFSPRMISDQDSNNAVFAEIPSLDNVTLIGGQFSYSAPSYVKEGTVVSHLNFSDYSIDEQKKSVNVSLNDANYDFYVLNDSAGNVELVRIQNTNNQWTGPISYQAGYGYSFTATASDHTPTAHTLAEGYYLLQTTDLDLDVSHYQWVNVKPDGWMERALAKTNDSSNWATLAVSYNNHWVYDQAGNWNVGLLADSSNPMSGGYTADCESYIKSIKATYDQCKYHMNQHWQLIDMNEDSFTFNVVITRTALPLADWAESQVLSQPDSEHSALQSLMTNSASLQNNAYVDRVRILQIKTKKVDTLPVQFFDFD